MTASGFGSGFFNEGNGAAAAAGLVPSIKELRILMVLDLEISAINQKSLRLDGCELRDKCHQKRNAPC